MDVLLFVFSFFSLEIPVFKVVQTDGIGTDVSLSMFLILFVASGPASTRSGERGSMAAY